MGTGGTPIVSTVQAHLWILGEVFQVCPNGVSQKLRVLTDSAQKAVGQVQLILDVSSLQLLMHSNVVRMYVALFCCPPYSRQRNAILTAGLAEAG